MSDLRDGMTAAERTGCDCDICRSIVAHPCVVCRVVSFNRVDGVCSCCRNAVNEITSERTAEPHVTPSEADKGEQSE